MSRLLIPAILLGALSLSACGKQGTLDRPAPLFGRSAQAEYMREKRAADRAAGESTADQSATSQTNGDYTHGSDGGSKDPALRPMRTDPIPGAANDPFGSKGNGVLPDPYANPNSTPR
jgi:hypothetical protein